MLELSKAQFLKFIIFLHYLLIFKTVSNSEQKKEIYLYKIKKIFYIEQDQIPSLQKFIVFTFSKSTKNT